jgi:hypothetical protein
MSTYKCIREVYESAADAADTIKREIKHYDADEERQQELVSQEADRLCIYTQDNWDVVNIMRCSDEMVEAQEYASMGEFEGIDSHMAVLAFYVWGQLISEALQEDE